MSQAFLSIFYAPYSTLRRENKLMTNRAFSVYAMLWYDLRKPLVNNIQHYAPNKEYYKFSTKYLSNKI